MKKIILFIAIIFITITSAQAEQWISIKIIPNISDAAAIMLDLDSITLNNEDDSVSFYVKKDDAQSVYIHNFKYSYKTKQFALLESTKYRSWVAPENLLASHKFEEPIFKPSQPNSLSEKIEMIISNKSQLDYIKNYASYNKKFLEKKLAKSLKKLDGANIQFWIDGTGKIYSYKYIFGNYDDSKELKLVKNNDNLINYILKIERHPKTTGGNSSDLNIFKKTYNTVNKKTYDSYSGEWISPQAIQRAMLPNMPSLARIAIEAGKNNSPMNYGTLSNKDFFDAFISVMSNKNLQDKQKIMAMRLFAVQNVNYNEELNKQLYEITNLKPFSSTLTKGAVGIIINLQ